MDPSHRKLVAMFILQFASLIALFCTESPNVGVMLDFNQNALLLQNGRGGSEQGRIQSYNRILEYSDFNLTSFYNDIIFKQRFRMTKETFNFLCQQLAPSILTSDSKWRKAVPVDTKVAIALTRLASGSPLYIVADTFGVGVSTVHKIVLEFCHVLKKHCRDVFIRWPSPSRFKDISERFEALHGIPYIVRAIDGSHIPITASA